MAPKDSVAHPSDVVEAEETVSASPSKARKNPRVLQTRVSFHQIEIREYSRCMGDNPATTHGPPLSIGWDYNVAGTYGVEDYEETRPPRRAAQQMVVPGAVREDILLTHTDVTKKEINKVVSQIRDLRSRRQMSVALVEVEDYMRLGEAIARRIRRWRTGISKKREQELLWENAQRVMETKARTSNDVSQSQGLWTEEFSRDSSFSSASGMDQIEPENQ
jgi:hypothetical protein